MKYSLISVFLFSAAIVGCGSRPEMKENSAASTPAQAKPEVRMLEPVANIDLPPATANKVAQNRSLLERANRNARVDVNPGGKPAPMVFKPAPENSQIAVAMEADGTIREIRIFQDHPILAKAELSVRPNGQRVIWLTLKSGSTATVADPKIESLVAVTAGQLLALAGK